MRPDPSNWQDAKVYDSHGDRIGRVDGLFVDKESQQPEWLVVDTGFTGPEVLVPITGLEEVNDGIQLPFSEEQVKNAPSTGDVDVLTADQERELYNYYGIPYSTDVSGTILPADTGEQFGTRDRGTGSGFEEAGAREGAREDAGSRESMLEGEESGARAGTSEGQSGLTEDRPRSVRLRKRIVTEHVQVDVPVEREEIIVESDEGDTTTGTGLDEEQPGRRAA